MNLCRIDKMTSYLYNRVSVDVKSTNGLKREKKKNKKIELFFLDKNCLYIYFQMRMSRNLEREKREWKLK